MSDPTFHSLKTITIDSCLSGRLLSTRIAVERCKLPSHKRRKIGIAKAFRITSMEVLCILVRFTTTFSILEKLRNCTVIWREYEWYLKEEPQHWPTSKIYFELVMRNKKKVQHTLEIFTYRIKNEIHGIDERIIET